MNTQHDRPSTTTLIRAWLLRIWSCCVDVDRARVAARTTEPYMKYGNGQGLRYAMQRSK